MWHVHKVAERADYHKESQETTTYSVSQLSEETVIEYDFEFMQQQGMVSMQESEANTVSDSRN